MTSEANVQSDQEAAAAPAAVSEATSQEDSPHMVPVTEARRYRKRAQAAEQSASELKSKLEEASRRANELEQAVDALERRQRVDQLLVEAETIDLESARLLTEMAISAMDEPDVDAAVADLRRRKPHLFRATAGRARSMSPRVAAPNGVAAELDDAAAEAQISGNRLALLRYLRLRRRER